MASRNTTTERICPDCQGAGEVFVRNPLYGTSNCPDEGDDEPCPNKDCVDGWIRFAPVDPLLMLAHYRRQRAYRAAGLYAKQRAAVMKPVRLPKLRLVVQAERDARAALQNHAFVMGHFERLMGLAA